MSNTMAAPRRSVEVSERSAPRSPCADVTEFVCHDAMAQIESSDGSLIVSDLNNVVTQRQTRVGRFSKMCPTWTEVA